MPWLSIITSLFGGLTGGVKDYFNYKRELQAKERDYQLALLTAQVDMAKSQNESNALELRDRLKSTSQVFKQSTFWFMTLPVVLTIIFPTYAKDMWHNFSLIPEYFQWLYLSVYSAIWGIPMVKGGYGAFTEFLSKQRDYKIEKLMANDEAMYNVLRKKLFKDGMTQGQVDVIKEAITARESKNA